MKNRRFKKRNLRSGGSQVRKACSWEVKTEKCLIKGYKKRCSESQLAYGKVKFQFHETGFYATFLNDVCHHGFNSKYLPKVKPTVRGVYKVDRIVAKRVQ